jgi:hypothetical protein
MRLPSEMIARHGRGASFLLALFPVLAIACTKNGGPPPTGVDPVVVTIGAEEWLTDSARFSVSTSRPVNSLAVTWAEGEGVACARSAEFVNGRYVLTPVKKGEIKYTVCAKATASDGGTGIGSKTVTSPPAPVVPNQCTDPVDKLEYVDVTIRFVQDSTIFTRTLDPVRIGVACADGSVRMYSLISSHIISVDGFHVYEGSFPMTVGPRSNVLAVGYYNDQTAKLIRWLKGSEFTVRIKGQPVSSGINLSTQLGKTIPHGCADGNGCFDPDPWLLKLDHNGSGGYVLSN